MGHQIAHQFLTCPQPMNWQHCFLSFPPECKDYAESDSDWKASGQPKLLPAGQVNWGRHGRIFELNANGTAAYIWRTGETVELIVCSDLIIIPATLVTAVYQQF